MRTPSLPCSAGTRWLANVLYSPCTAWCSMTLQWHRGKSGLHQYGSWQDEACPDAQAHSSSKQQAARTCVWSAVRTIRCMRPQTLPTFLCCTCGGSKWGLAVVRTQQLHKTPMHHCPTPTVRRATCTRPPLVVAPPAPRPVLTLHLVLHLLLRHGRLACDTGGGRGQRQSAKVCRPLRRQSNPVVARS